MISAAWGLGETVVQGTINPDKYLVFKPLLARAGARADHRKDRSAPRSGRWSTAAAGSARTKTVDTTDAERRAFVLADAEILALARWAVSVEEHYGRPMDMEWAKDGVTGELFMVQARPETVQSQKTGSAVHPPPPAGDRHRAGARRRDRRFHRRRAPPA